MSLKGQKTEVAKGNKAGLKILAASIFVLSLAGCADIESVETGHPKVSEKNIKRSLSQNAKFSLQELDIPHQYQVLVSWPAEIINVVIEDSGKRVFETDSVRQYAHAIKDNSKFNFRVFSYDNEQPVLIGEFSGTTPKDYSINAFAELKEDLIIESSRVFLSSEAKIQTNGHKLIIKADKFYSDNAEVFSFPEGSKALPEQDGLSGGAVQIQARVAFGHLRVHLRGQNGGDGLDGLPWDTRAAQGSAGRGGAHECVKASVGGIGIGGPLKCWCTRGPSNGGAGAKGDKGRDGTRAGHGGHSGSVIVEIQEKTEFVVEPFQNIGLGGNPGKGGLGQQGGIGGPAGDRSSSECSSASQGAEGPRGDSGLDAPASSNGNIESLCISIGQGVGKCQAK